MSEASGHVTIRKNTGANVGTQPRVNLVEGANVTLTITNDNPNHEVNITIASAAGGGTGLDDQFFPATDPNNRKGLWPAVLMLDGEETIVYQSFNIPANFSSIDTAVVLVIPEGTGDLRRTVATDIAACGQNFETHQDSVAAGQVVVTTDEIECIDISGALTPAIGGDFVGMSFTRSGENALDTINADVYYLGVYVQGTI